MTTFAIVAILVVYVNVDHVDKFPSIEPPHYKGQMKHILKQKELQ